MGLNDAAWGTILLMIPVGQICGMTISGLIVFGFFGIFCNISVNTQAISLEAIYNKPIMASFHGGWSLAGLTGASIGLLMASIHLHPLYHFCIIGVIVIVTVIINKAYLQPDDFLHQ